MVYLKVVVLRMSIRHKAAGITYTGSHGRRRLRSGSVIVSSNSSGSVSCLECLLA